MGTRSITKFYETYTDSKTEKQKKVVICAMYKQYDGYPSGLGKELAIFLTSRQLVNGIGENNLVFNGAGCLAAQVITMLKTGEDGLPKAGGIYMTPTNCSDEQYRYEIIIDSYNYDIAMKVYEIGARNKRLFYGTPQNFLLWLENQKM